MLEARRIEPRAHLFEDLFDPRAHHADQLGPLTVRRSWCQSPVSPSEFDDFAIIHAGGDHPAEPGLDPFGVGHRNAAGPG
jgi:hypothetical protein